MPASLQLSADHKENLTVIFVECQALEPEKLEAFLYEKEWMGTDALWAMERPFSTGSRTLPSFALLSNEGKLLLKGSPRSMKSKIEETIKKEISRSKKGPDDVPKSLKKAWKDFCQAKYGSAFKATRPDILGSLVHPYLFVAIFSALYLLPRHYRSIPAGLIRRAAGFYALFIITALMGGGLVSFDHFIKLGATLFTIGVCATMVRSRGDFVAGVLGLCIGVGAMAVYGCHT